MPLQKRREKWNQYIGFCRISIKIALEVKHSSHIHSKDLRGVVEFKQDYPQAQLSLLYRGNEILKKGDVMCYPVELFLLKLSPQALSL